MAAGLCILIFRLRRNKINRLVNVSMTEIRHRCSDEWKGGKPDMLEEGSYKGSWKKEEEETTEKMQRCMERGYRVLLGQDASKTDGQEKSKKQPVFTSVFTESHVKKKWIFSVDKCEKHRTVIKHQLPGWPAYCFLILHILGVSLVIFIVSTEN